MNCSAEGRFAYHPCCWQEDVRGTGDERDHKSQEPPGLVGRRTGVAKSMTPDRGRAESLLICTANCFSHTIKA